MWPEEIIEYLECGCGFRGNKCGRLSGSVKVESMSRRPWPSSFRGTGRTSQNSQPATASQIFTDLHRSSQFHSFIGERLDENLIEKYRKHRKTMFKISKIKNIKNNEKSVNIFGLAPFSFGRTTEVPPTVTVTVTI